jgi:hypothetical protein
MGIPLYVRGCSVGAASAKRGDDMLVTFITGVLSQLTTLVASLGTALGGLL